MNQNQTKTTTNKKSKGTGCNICAYHQAKIQRENKKMHPVFAALLMKDC